MPSPEQKTEQKQSMSTNSPLKLGPAAVGTSNPGLGFTANAYLKKKKDSKKDIANFLSI